MPQRIHFCRYVCGSLRLCFRRPQFLDHLVRLQAGLRIHVLKQDFQQFPELALACEALATQDSFDLVPDGGGIHKLVEAAIELWQEMITRDYKELEQRQTPVVGQFEFDPYCHD
jgi:hypothetical protein